MVAGRILFLGLVGFGLFRLRRAGVGGAGVYRVPLYPLLPALFVAGMALLLLGRVVFQWRQTLVDLALLACTLPLLLFERRRERLRRAT